MNYGLSYREKHNLDERDLTDAQSTLHYIAENMRMEKSISEDGYRYFQQAIEALEPHHCEDAISRQAAIDYLMDNMTWYSEDGYETDEDEKRDSIESLINAVPSVTPQQRWIPVSERLPEVNQRVLVTSYGRVCYAMMISADGNSGYPIFRLQDSLNERVICETTVHSKFTTSRITAWMPLPQPMKVRTRDEMPISEEHRRRVFGM